MDKLSREELLALISEKPKKERKKPTMTEDKRIEMLGRLAEMRETVKKNREAKKEATANPAIKEKEIDAIFEKKYTSHFDKMNALLTDLNENTKEVVKIKKDKLAKKAEEKIIETPPPPAPKVIEPPKNVAEPLPVQVHPPPPAAIQQLPPPPVIRKVLPVNPNIHFKGKTRF
jgi:hypothetical protein